MKLKYLLYAAFALALAFAGVMGYLLYSESRPVEGVSASSSLFDAPVLSDRGQTVSGKGGQLLIAYAGDINGSLDPCG